MGAQADQLKERTMQFAIDVCRLLRSLPSREPGSVVQRQLARSATGIAFNYRAACRARSQAEFVARINVVAEEADECQGWLVFTQAADLLASAELARLQQEATELCAIFSASVRTARLELQRRRCGP